MCDSGTLDNEAHNLQGRKGHATILALPTPGRSAGRSLSYHLPKPLLHAPAEVTPPLPLVKTREHAAEDCADKDEIDENGHRFINLSMMASASAAFSLVGK